MVKRIAIIAEYSKGTGIGTYLELVIKHLIKKEKISTHVYFVNSDRNEVSEFIGLFSKQDFGHTILNYYPKRFIFKKIAKFPASLFLDLVIFQLFFLCRKPDFILVSTSSITKYWGALLFRKQGAYIFHSVPRKFKNYFFVNSNSIIYRILQNGIFLVAVSGFTKKTAIEALNLPEERVKVIHNTVNRKIPDIYPVKIVKSVIEILTLSNIVGYKNIELWFEVATSICKKNNKVQFTWAGNCIDKILYNSIKSKISETKQTGIVIIPKSVEPSQYFLSCDIYFHPSKTENHSLSILEALYFGKPVVCADVGGNSESVEHNTNGFLFQDNDCRDAIKNLTCLIEDEATREKFSFNSKEIFNAKFSIDKWEAKMDKLFED